MRNLVLKREASVSELRLSSTLYTYMDMCACSPVSAHGNASAHMHIRTRTRNGRLGSRGSPPSWRILGKAFIWVDLVLVSSYGDYTG